MSLCHRFLPEEMGDKLRLVCGGFLAEVFPKSSFAFQTDALVTVHILCTFFNSLVGEIPKS